jgi:putative NIF3 family GTP cyclohydrolase 1 type 2
MMLAMPDPPTLDDLAAFLLERLGPDAGDAPAVWRGGGAVRALGFALEPRPGLELEARGLDAVFLHRPFRLPARALPGVAVLASHDGFDARLTTGFNEALAERLGLDELAPLERGGVRVGMVGSLGAPVAWPELEARVAAQFGGLEASEPNGAPAASRLAVANAMDGALVRAAAGLGAGAYLTGQVRAPGRAAARELGVGVLAAGHRRAELWGLRRLAREFAAAFPGLETRVLER